MSRLVVVCTTFETMLERFYYLRDLYFKGQLTLPEFEEMNDLAYELYQS